MTTLTIMRGVSGSGKSTIARALADATNAQIVSRDDIRMGMFGVEFDPAIEDRVSVVEHSAIAGFLKAGIDVISDNTHIEWKYVKGIAKIGYRHGAEVKIHVVDVPLGTCIARNDLRALHGGRNVPENVIRKQHERFQGTKNKELDPVFKPKPYAGTKGKKHTVLVDIDGTLAHMRDYRGPFDWSKVHLDDPDDNVIDVVNGLKKMHYTIVVMSGRDEVSRSSTEAWLNEYGVPFDALFMRPEKDMRPDNIVKAELFDKYVRNKYDVQFVIDDRDQVVDMWRAMGLPCFQVAPGDF